MQKVRDFLISKYFLIITFFLAGIVTVTGQEVIGVVVFAFIICTILVLTDDVLATTLPFLLLSAFVIKCYDSFDTFIKLWWIAIPVVAVFIFHFIKYKKHFTIGKAFWGILASSVAITLGGLGKITAAEYFSGTSLFYILGLGFGMLGVYMIVNAYFEVNERYSLRIRFSQIMMLYGLFACFMILEHYLVNISTVIDNPAILDFQWRNNVSTILMLALPFPFYLSARKHWYMTFGLIIYLCMLLAGSRGGLIFGSIEFVMCLVMVIIYDKKHRKKNTILLSLLLVAFILVSRDLFSFISKTIERILNFDENKIRLNLMKRAIEDFQSNPIFGRGLGYMGNRDVHKSKEFSLCWYHSSPFQIIGSFGIVGIIGFVVQYFVRIKIYLSKRTIFNATLFLAYVGIEMMSLVNPGVFCPVPFLLMVNMFFIIMEKCNAKEITPVKKRKKHQSKEPAAVNNGN